jgi:hypothetical protein
MRLDRELVNWAGGLANSIMIRRVLIKYVPIASTALAECYCGRDEAQLQGDYIHG